MLVAFFLLIEIRRYFRDLLEAVGIKSIVMFTIIPKYSLFNFNSIVDIYL
jgi:hypothetical protein